jgi:hypothetical protein
VPASRPGTGFQFRRNRAVHAPQPINVFATFRVTADGDLVLDDCVSQPGDAAMAVHPLRP